MNRTFAHLPSNSNRRSMLCCSWLATLAIESRPEFFISVKKLGTRCPVACTSPGSGVFFAERRTHNSHPVQARAHRVSQPPTPTQRITRRFWVGRKPAPRLNRHSNLDSLAAYFSCSFSPGFVLDLRGPQQSLCCGFAVDRPNCPSRIALCLKKIV